jgi:hypothetical protein
VRVGRATALFLASCGIPIVGAGLVPVEAGWREVFIVIVAVAWGVPAVFGGVSFHVSLGRRCRRLDASPWLPGALLFGLAFSTLPLGLWALADLAGGGIGLKEALLILACAGTALGLAFAGLTPLRPAPPGG